MEIVGIKDRDIELRRGDTLRETYHVALEDGTAVDASDWTFTRIIHKLGDESEIYATLDVTMLDDATAEAFLSAGASAALPAPSIEPILAHKTRFTSPAGDAKTIDVGRIFMKGE
jgi:hypothetical protein